MTEKKLTSCEQSVGGLHEHVSQLLASRAKPVEQNILQRVLGQDVGLAEGKRPTSVTMLQCFEPVPPKKKTHILHIKLCFHDREKLTRTVS